MENPERVHELMEALLLTNPREVADCERSIAPLLGPAIVSAEIDSERQQMKLLDRQVQIARHRVAIEAAVDQKPVEAASPLGDHLDGLRAVGLRQLAEEDVVALERAVDRAVEAFPQRRQGARAHVLSCMHDPQNMPAPPAVRIAMCIGPF